MGNLIQKWYGLKRKIHLVKIKYKNRKGHFIYKGNELDLVFDISVSHRGVVEMEFVWGGAGAVKIKTVGDGKVYIGKNVCMNANVYIVGRKNIYVGEGTMFGPNVVIFDHDHDYRSVDWRNKYICKDIYIGKNVWIGANVTILMGSYIGDNSVVGAGTVVKGRIPENTIYYSKQIVTEKPFERISH